MSMRNYGSAPGELAACLTHVGIVDRTDLARVGASGPAGAILGMLDRLIGDRISVGGSIRSGESWWSQPAPDQILVLCPPVSQRRVARLLRDEALHHRGVAVDDRADSHACLGVVGKQTPDVLDALGVYRELGSPRGAAPCRVGHVADVEVTWLLESDVSAVVCVPRDRLDETRHAIEARSRAFGMARVGREAFDNYAILERREHQHHFAS